MNENLKERIAVTELFNLQRVNNDDIADRLFYEYFSPVEPHTKEIKQFIMQQYNTVAAIVNAAAGFKRMIILTPSLKHEITHPEHRVPCMKKEIYVAVKPVDVKELKLKPYQQAVIDTVKKSDKRTPAPRKPKPVEKPLKKTKAKSTPATKTRTAGTSGISAEIIALCEQGKTQNEIIAAGYLRNTVVPVVWKWKKSKIKNDEK